jgi:hypothetical protein
LITIGRRERDMVRSCGAALVLLLAANPVRAQNEPDMLAAFSNPAQLTEYFELLTRLKVAVEKTKGDHEATYKAVGVRLYGCAYAYGGLARKQDLDAAARARYRMASELYAHAAGGLYPDSLAELQQDYAKSLAASKSESARPPHSARKCDGLSDRRLETVYSAVLDLTEQSTRP